MRTERLINLLQKFRRYRRPVSGRRLAEDLGISLRSLYRDIETLRGLGADIAGEAGVGYVLRSGFFLPPLMLSQAELDALLLGMRWVGTFGDRSLVDSANNALCKIATVLPVELRDGAGAVPLRVGPSTVPQLASEDLADLRDAIRRERKLRIRYCDRQERESERIIWPFAIGYFNQGRILVGWCETRQAYRHFRTAALSERQVLDEHYPRKRAVMFREWRESQIR